MREDIRLRTKLIIRKDGYWLQGVCFLTQEVLWCADAWAAWGTRDREAALRVAQRVGGAEIWLFNPVAGQKRQLTAVGKSAKAG